MIYWAWKDHTNNAVLGLKVLWSGLYFFTQIRSLFSYTPNASFRRSITLKPKPEINKRIFFFLRNTLDFFSWRPCQLGLLISDTSSVLLLWRFFFDFGAWRTVKYNRNYLFLTTNKIIVKTREIEILF